MNESTPSTNPTDPTNEYPVIDRCAEQAKRASKSIKGWGGPTISILSYGLIIGFALSGLGMMMLSALLWLLFGISTFSGFGLLTGGLCLSAATALFLGKLAKVGDSLYATRQKQPVTG